MAQGAYILPQLPGLLTRIIPTWYASQHIQERCDAFCLFAELYSFVGIHIFFFKGTLINQIDNRYIGDARIRSKARFRRYDC